MRITKLAKLIGSISYHGIFIALVLYFIWPIITLYWKQHPAVGIDLFLTVDFVTFIQNNLNWPFLSWKYIWYGGTPLAQTYPFLHFYLIQPLLNFFSAVQAVQAYVLGSMILYVVFSYMLYYSLSKSRGLSAVLAIATGYSYNLWSALYWAGSIPYISTMFLLPLSLYLVILGYERGKKQNGNSLSPNFKYILLSAMLCGVFILGHPQSFISYTVPFATLLLIFYSSDKIKFFAKWKFGIFLLYGLVIFLIGLPQIGVGVGVLNHFFTILTKAFGSGVSEIQQSTYAEAARQTDGNPVMRLLDVYRRSNPLFFWAMGAGVGAVFITTFSAFVVKRRVSHHIKLFLPFVLMALYLLLFLYAFVLGINPITGGWFRAFWPSMTVFGAIVAVMWRVSAENLGILIGKLSSLEGAIKFFRWTGGELAGLVVLVIGIFYLLSTYDNFYKETLRYVELSSAYPTSLSINLEKGNWPQKLPTLTPSWMDPNNLNYRLYDMDATVNIWWNSVFKMPLARGYLDANPKKDGAQNYGGWQYWQNTTLLKDEAVKSWDVPPEIAKQQAKFLLDWSAIKYIEGQQNLQRTYGSNVSSYILDDKDIVSRIGSAQMTAPFVMWNSKGERFFEDSKQELKYYEISDRFTSGIYNTTNAPAILVVGDSIGQDIMMRNIASLGLTSKQAITVQWNDNADKLSLKDLTNFDVVFLYRYKYKDKGKLFRQMEKYVNEGGKLFLETGTEQKESNSASLPAVFPFESSQRKPLGNSWDFKVEKNKITEGVDFSLFGEPVFDGSPWNFTFPASSLKSQTTALVSNHGQPVLVHYKLGKGEILWSGMNFPGHVQGFKNLEEFKLFKNLLFSLHDFSKDQLASSKYERPSSEKAIIKGSNAKAVLFKEAAYPGWHLKIKSGGKTQKVKIFEAGPLVPGYMYAPIPPGMRQGEFEAIFEYKGELEYKLTYLVSFISLLLVLDYIILGRKGIAFLGRRSSFLHKGIGKWWAKEDE